MITGMGCGRSPGFSTAFRDGTPPSEDSTGVGNCSIIHESSLYRAMQASLMTMCIFVLVLLLLVLWRQLAADVSQQLVEPSHVPEEIVSRHP